MPYSCSIRSVSALIVAGIIAISGVGSRAHAQIENPVYVDDSPQAWELFRQAQDQVRNNAGEAVRLFQELLDEFGMKLIPVSEASPEHYRSVRERVNQSLLSDPDLLNRYRLIQTATAQQFLEAGELEQLVLTRALTEAGLEAMLRLAQQKLESGHFRSAVAWLSHAENHPDLVGRKAAHRHYISGLARQYLGEVDRAQQHLAQLAELIASGAQPRSELEALHAQLQSALLNQHRSASAQQTLSTLDFAPGAEVDDLTDLVAQAIWSVPLQNSLAQRRANSMREDQPFNSNTQSTAIDPRMRDADLTSAVPTVSGEIVYVNEGHTVRAHHRLTGKEQWVYNNTNAQASLNERDVQGSLDLNVVAVVPGPAGAIVTLTGYAQPNVRSEAGRVICLDPENGSNRWSAPLSGLVDSAATNEQLFPHGAPIILDDLVLVAARRVSMQAITSAYVVAIDLVTGDPRWVRYITSTGGLQARIRPFCNLVEHEGSIYISSAVGAVARLDPQTGQTNWLVRFSTPITSGYAEQTRRPWEIGGPVVTRRGVITIEPDQRRVVLLDTQTGSRLENHIAGSGTAWNLPRYLIADNERVYAIGAEIRAFDLDDLDAPTWQLPPADPQQSPAQESSTPQRAPNQNQPQPVTESFELRGRVQVLEGALVVPTNQGILVIDSETGALRNHLPVETAGNPLAHESQLLLASGTRLDSYMSFSKAERMLRDRIAQAPSEPEPALSLLRLGMRVRNLQLALEAAELANRAVTRLATASASVERVREVRSELLTLLLELAQARIAQTQAEGELVFAAISAAAVESAERVEFLLAYGQWLADHAIDRSVEAYQTILSDKNLAEAWRMDAGLMRPAAAWARDRLSALIASRGPAVYTPQADFASVRLKQLLAAKPVNPASLRALAQEFPFSDAAVEASLQAALALQQRGDVRGAYSALISAYLAAPTSKTVQPLMGRFISIALGAGEVTLVEDTIRHLIEAHGNVTLQLDSGSMTAQAWLNANSPPLREFATRLPVIGDSIGPAQPMAGSLVNMHRLATLRGSMPGLGERPADRALLRVGNTVRLIGSAGPEPIWTTTIHSINPEIIRMDHRGVLLWLDEQGPAAQCTMLDPATGQVKWTSPVLNPLLAQPANTDREPLRPRDVRSMMADGEQFDPRQLLPLANDRSLIIVQRNGSCMSLDLADGTTAKWKRAQTLEQVHFAALHSSALVLAGVVRDPERSSELVARIMILDPDTGQPQFEQTAALQHLGRGGIRWVRITPLGVLTYATAQGIHALDLYSGRRLWSNSSYEAIDPQRCWLFDNLLIIEDQRNRLRSIDLVNGTMGPPFEAPSRGEWDPLELRQVAVVNQRVVTRYPQRIVMYNAQTGAIEGADMITDDRDYRFLVAGANRYVLVSGRTMQAQIPDQPGRRSQRWTYRMYDLSENSMVLGPPYELEKPLNERVQQVIAIDNWLLMSTQSETLAIPRTAAE